LLWRIDVVVGDSEQWIGRASTTGHLLAHESTTAFSILLAFRGMASSSAFALVEDAIKFIDDFAVAAAQEEEEKTKEEDATEMTIQSFVIADGVMSWTNFWRICSKYANRGRDVAQGSLEPVVSLRDSKMVLQARCIRHDTTM
jgi:hypothetical protein